MDKQTEKRTYKRALSNGGTGEYLVDLSKTLHTCHLVLAPCQQCSVEATIDAFGYDNLYD
ncbi:MAG: hypothetical protein JSS83_19370 [Cyanobacteria bacterium SZAS LIN-3]|nr:hypothetical protein [Cyanobacteria bacterium SZAS LIN-3]